MDTPTDAQQLRKHSIFIMQVAVHHNGPDAAYTLQALGKYVVDNFADITAALDMTADSLDAPAPVIPPEPDYETHLRTQELAENQRLNAADESLQNCTRCWGTIVNGVCDTCDRDPAPSAAQPVAETHKPGNVPAYYLGMDPEPDYDEHLRRQEVAETIRLNGLDETLQNCAFCGAGKVVQGACDTCGAVVKGIYIQDGVVTIVRDQPQPAPEPSAPVATDERHHCEIVICSAVGTRQIDGHWFCNRHTPDDLRAIEQRIAAGVALPSPAPARTGAKLSKAQRDILKALINGDRIWKDNVSWSSVHYLVRSKRRFNWATVEPLWNERLIDLNSGDNYGNITDLGRQALASHR